MSSQGKTGRFSESMGASAGPSSSSSGSAAPSASGSSKSVPPPAIPSTSRGLGSQRIITEGDSARDPADLIIPTTLVRKIMKTSSEETCTTGNFDKDVVFLITKASELYITDLCREAHALCEDGTNKLDYDKLAGVVKKYKGGTYDFLTNIIPEKMTYAEALAQREKRKKQDEEELDDILFG